MHKEIPFAVLKEIPLLLAIVRSLLWSREFRLRLPVTTLGHRVRILNLLESVAVHVDNVTLQMRGAALADFFANNPVLAVLEPSSFLLVRQRVVEGEYPVSRGGSLLRLFGFCIYCVRRDNTLHDAFNNRKRSQVAAFVEKPSVTHNRSRRDTLPRLFGHSVGNLLALRQSADHAIVQQLFAAARPGLTVDI